VACVSGRRQTAVGVVRATQAQAAPLLSARTSSRWWMLTAELRAAVASSCVDTEGM
jgi:hypothetical protein